VSYDIDWLEKLRVKHARILTSTAKGDSMEDAKKMQPSDIPHAWQKRRDELAQLLRDCKHDARVLENDQGNAFCERCGIKLPRG